jgi:hypothetical protein
MVFFNLFKTGDHRHWLELGIVFREPFVNQSSVVLIHPREPDSGQLGAKDSEDKEGSPRPHFSRTKVVREPLPKTPFHLKIAQKSLDKYRLRIPAAIPIEFAARHAQSGKFSI